ncbi:MAG: beta-ketoacyl-[acyl-carrier-protein] synthase family protein [Candidatus Methylomirabilia bacterium]
MNTRSVVVTGLGLMTGLGLDLESCWAGLLEGRNAVRRFTLFDPEGLPTPFGVELPAGADELFARQIMKRSRDQMTRGTMLALATAQMAIADAGLEAADFPRGRVGVVLGTTGTGYTGGAEEIDQHRILRNMSNSPAAWVSLKFKFAGPSFVVGTACSSGAYALAAAHWLIASGQADAVVTGAADSSLNRLDVQGFSSLMALAEDPGDMTTASRPFDRARSGFVIGEGGGVLVLESRETAQRRGARVYALMPPPGLSSEAYNILSPQTGGGGMAVCMQRALENAGLAPESIDYINAHGTSTRINDLYETQAIHAVFGDKAGRVAVSSTKSLTGHCLAGAAGVEAVICCKALVEGLIPPTWHLTDPDPELDLDFVPNAPRRRELRNVMSNSFAFGGHNGVAIFSRDDGA